MREIGRDRGKLFGLGERIEPFQKVARVHTKNAVKLRIRAWGALPSLVPLELGPFGVVSGSPNVLPHNRPARLRADLFNEQVHRSPTVNDSIVDGRRFL